MDEKNYKIATMLAVIVTAAALAVTILALTFRPQQAVSTQGLPEESNTGYYTPKLTSSQENSASSPAPSEETYRVALYEGKIGVFRQGETEPFLTADVSVYLLPQEDIALLRKGIAAQSLQEVKSILEDYE